MKTEIFTRDYKAPPPLKDRVSDYVKNLVKNPKIKNAFKNPKITTILILILTLAVVFIALFAISSGKNAAKLDFPETTAQIPQPVSKTASPSASQIDTQLSDFYNTLEDNRTVLNLLSKPIVEFALDLP